MEMDGKDKPKTATPRRGKVAPKAEAGPVAPLEMVPAPTVHLEIDPSNIGAFRAFGKVNNRVVAINAKKQTTVQELYDMTEAVVGWLVAYAHADEAELDGLNFAALSQVWQQAGAAYTGATIPQTKGTP